MTPAELARQVRLLELSTRRRVTEVFAGEYTSAFKGRGMEFSEVREYQPGDDVRFIDWNVTARSGKPFIKRFVEERELTVMLVVDLSGSFEFGTAPRGLEGHAGGEWSVLADGSKRALAAKVGALLAFAAVRSGDRVGLCAFTDRIEHYVPPRKGSRHALRLVRELLALEPVGRGTDLAPVADRFRRVLHRRSLIFVVSDFLPGTPDGTGALERSLRRLGGAGHARGGGHDVIAAVVRDRRDAELVAAGLVRVRDPETGREAVIDTSSRRVREAYAEAFRRSNAELDRALVGAGLRGGRARVDLWTHEPPVHSLVELFHRRER
jgi:uncharacterized protein (DUF58 family)